MGMPMPMASSRDLPFYAPWFVDQILAERTALRQSPADAAVTQLRTSLDLSLQQLLQRQLQGYVREQGIHNIRNAAAMLVDTRDMGVRALIGSADYFNREIQGQVNGTLAKRSPGSTLKPFIYGLAFDQGVAIPATVLRDLPSAFGPYTPENFDGSFDGPVTVTQALIRSRNIPAVDVAARLHHPDFYEFLRGAGISGLAPESHYGLALVLGGGEISMQEMATLYALLANAGRLQPLQFLVQDGSQPEQSAPQLLSAEASYMVLDILRQNPPPLLADTGQGRRIPVAWKTGTSAGFRDAWTAAVFSHYVLIVWLGNFNGISNSALVGADAAAPLAFRLIDAIKASKQDLPPAIPPPPPRLRRVEVCLSSGALPTVWCPRRGQSWFTPGVSPITVDTVYRPLWVDKVSGQPVCPPYDPHRQEPRVFAYWSSALRQNFAAAGLPLALPPPSPHCANATDSLGSPPRIRSPLRGETYLLKADDGVRSDVPLSADADADVGSLYWFADSAYLGRTAAGQSLSWRPEQAGIFLLRVVDDHGRSDSRSIRIGLLP
jgi:penicillin-binding protein 1C